MLDHSTIVHPLDDIVRHCLHRVLLLPCILIEGHFERLLVQFMPLRKILPLELESDIVRLAHQVLDIFGQLSLCNWYFSLIRTLFLLHLDLSSEGDDLAFAQQLLELLC